MELAILFNIANLKLSWFDIKEEIFYFNLKPYSGDQIREVSYYCSLGFGFTFLLKLAVPSLKWLHNWFGQNVCIQNCSWYQCCTTPPSLEMGCYEPTDKFVKGFHIFYEGVLRFKGVVTIIKKIGINSFLNNLCFSSTNSF